MSPRRLLSSTARCVLGRPAVDSLTSVITIEPRVDFSKLEELLAEAHESDHLEYVASCNLDERRDVVELASEHGALAARGGYLVVGADDRGRTTGTLDARMAGLFDDATVRDKLGRYLPELELHVGRHDYADRPIVVIAVMPHPDGAVVFAADDAYEHHGMQTVAFRKGDLFVRHGSKSERANQTDITRLRVQAVEQARLWMQQLDKLADLVMDLSRILDGEQDTHPDGRLNTFGVPTRIPIARERLKTGPWANPAVGRPRTACNLEARRPEPPCVRESPSGRHCCGGQ